MIDLLSQKALSTIRMFYDAPFRFYHDFSHIEDGISLFHFFKDELEDQQMFLLAWLFHDAIYEANPKGPITNEAASANLMTGFAEFWGFTSDQVQKARNMILATQHLKVKPQTSDEKYFVDLDLSILGRDPDTFLSYDQAVRKEFSHLSDEEWSKGRRAFLSSLDKDNLFHTEYFNDRYGRAAKRNISNYLK